MKKIFLLLLTISLIFFSCKSNNLNEKKIVKKELNYIPYYLKIYEADSLFESNNFEKSYQVLDSLFKVYKPLNTLNIYEYNNYVISSYKTKHFTDFKNKVIKIYKEFGGLGAYGRMKDSILSLSGLTNEDVLNLKQQYRHSLNDSLRLQIIRMEKEDQEVRTSNFSEIGMQDYMKKHEKELDEIFKKYGFPSEDLIGSVTYFNSECKEKLAFPFGILVHQGGNKNAKEKILPILLNYLKTGKCSPFLYANVYDKYELVYNNRQYYNSWEKVNIPIDTTKINRKRNDSIRRTIGLPSIAYDIWLEKKRNED
jgi:hypothetical protein